MAENSGDLSLGYMMGQSDGGGSNGGFGGDWGGLWGIIIAAMVLGYGRNGGIFGGGGSDGGFSGMVAPWATQADVRAAVDQQTLISKLDQQTYGLADTFTALNNTLNSNFRGIDNAICTLGYQSQAGFSGLGAQLASCCCDIERGIERSTTQGVMNTNAIQQQIASCCCDLEKMNMQNRFDAQAYNNNTLLAIDKLGDRILDYMSTEKMQALRDENQALRLAASQAQQNAFITANQEAQTAELIRRLGVGCPTPAYLVQPPTPVNFPTNGCGTVQFGGGYGGCGCGC